MTAALPLAIWPWPVAEADLEAVKRAKQDLALDYLVVPVGAVPGGPVRVLALREAPPFLCDYALIRDPSNDAAVTAGLSWVLHLVEEDARATLVIDQLRTVFGPDVREVFDGSVQHDYE